MTNNSQLPVCTTPPRWHFHGSVSREADSKPPTVSASLPKQQPEEQQHKEPEKRSFIWWDPIYSIPLGIMAAVPILHYEWYVVNEETLVSAKLDERCGRGGFLFCCCCCSHWSRLRFFGGWLVGNL